MHEQGVLNNGERISYAAGLMVGALNGVPQVSHTGSTAGYRAYLARYPQQKLGVALLCNVGSVNPGSVGQQVALAFLPESAQRATTRPVADADSPAPGQPENRPRPVLTAAQLEQYAGEYYSPDAEVTFHIAVEDSALVLRRRPNGRFVLQPTAEETFNAGGGIGSIRFIRDSSGRVTEFSLRQARVYDLRFSRVR